MSLASLLVPLVWGCSSGSVPTAPSATPTPPPVAAPPPGTEAPTPGPGPAAYFLAPPTQMPASPTDSVVGRYQLDLAIGLECAAVPASERNRRYTADIQAESVAGYDYVVRLYDASFLVALSCHEPGIPDAADICNQFRASRSGDALRFAFTTGPDDNWRGNMLFESLPGDIWLGITGLASGRLQGTTIVADGTVGVERWTGGLGGTPGATYRGCQGVSTRLTFSRR